MKAGVIGLVSGELNDISSFHDTFEKDGQKFTHSFQITETSYTSEGDEVLSGQAATQEVEDNTSVQIDDKTGEIVVSDEPLKKGKYTKFVIVPDRFVVVESGRGQFVFDLLSYEYSMSNVSRSSIDLNSYAEEYYTAEGVDPWQVGFYGNLGNAEKGVVYGEDVFSDGEIGDVLERSQLNQLGIQYEDGEYVIKITMSESGYVELYQPSNYESNDFAEFLIENVLEYTE